MVTWFAGLFYIVRLFIYQTEANREEEPKRTILTDQFKLMAKRLWLGITWPSAILILIFATWMLVEQPAFLSLPFMHLKLSFVFGLYLYHVYCHYIYRKLQNDQYPLSSFRLRLWNEVATIFLVAIIFVIVLRDLLSWVWGLAGIFVFAIFLWGAIKLYKRKRES